MNQQRQGFTLVELLLTLGVLAIGLGSILTLLPGVTRFSRELRDKDRMEIFAESVFDALEGSFVKEPLEEEPLSDLDPHPFSSLIGQQAFHISSTGPQPFETPAEEREWPDTGGAEGLVPVFYYTIQIQTVSPVEIKARIRVRPESSLTFTEYIRTIYPQVKAW